ncbi:Sec-independent protein translocase subunit TatC, partial [Arthrobacter stackebrandtii]
PPDVFSQTMLAVPMWVLFEVGLLACGMLKQPEQGKEMVPD